MVSLCMYYIFLIELQEFSISCSLILIYYSLVAYKACMIICIDICAIETDKLLLIFQI